MSNKQKPKFKPLAPRLAKPTVRPGRPERPSGPPPEIMTGDLGPRTSIHADLAAGLGVSSAKPRAAAVEPVEAPVAVPVERAFSDPVPPPPESVVANAPDGPIHRANCDPPSRT
jgi:hypothetical protein